MQNALLPNPPAPNAKPPQISQSSGLNALSPAGMLSGSPAMGSSGNGLSSPMAGPGAGAGSIAATPAPTHQQTVAGMRHFHAIESELDGLLSNPDLGKASIKSAAIDGATRLVAMGILKPSDAVTQLGTFPERPYDQRKWVEQQFQEAIQGQIILLAHHAAGAAGRNVDSTPPSPDNHLDHVSGLRAQYQEASNGGR